MATRMCTNDDFKDLQLWRESQILEVIPVSKSTFRRMVKHREFPAGIKVSARLKMWPAHVVFGWINKRAEQAQGALNGEAES